MYVPSTSYQTKESFVTKVAFAEDEGPFLRGSGKKLEKLSQLFGFNEKTKRGNSIT